MKTCINCNKPKEYSEFKKNGLSKDGYRVKCIDCELKLKTKKTVKYRSTRKLINPEHPIPVKMVDDDGFGGKWKFDIEQIKDITKTFIQSEGQKNHMVRRNLKCWQVKHHNLKLMETFCKTINMNTNAIIEFPKADKTLYVVNLFHSNILEVVR